MPTGSKEHPSGAGKTPEDLALNPNAKVPRLVDGSLALPESGALSVQVTERADRRADLIDTHPGATI